MSILDGDKKYELKDILTSFNYGKPLSAVNRRVVFSMAVLLGVMDFAMLVTLFVLLFTDQWQPEMWTIAVAIAVCAAVIALIVWLLKRADNLNSMLEDSLTDVTETTVVITNELYFYQDGSHALTHVARFSIDGENYVMTYSKTDLQPKDRKDIVYLLGERCRALYSHKNNDLLLLEVVRESEDGEIV